MNLLIHDLAAAIEREAGEQPRAADDFEVRDASFTVAVSRRGRRATTLEPPLLPSGHVDADVD